MFILFMASWHHNVREGNISCMSHPGEDKGGSLSVWPRPCRTGRRGSDRCVRQDQRESLPLVTRPFIFICYPAGRQHTASVVHTDFKTLHGSNILVLLFYPGCPVIGQTERQTAWSASLHFPLRETQIGPCNVQTNPDWSDQDKDSELKHLTWEFPLTLLATKLWKRGQFDRGETSERLYVWLYAKLMNSKLG